MSPVNTYPFTLPTKLFEINIGSGFCFQNRSSSNVLLVSVSRPLIISWDDTKWEVNLSLTEPEMRIGSTQRWVAPFSPQFR